MIVFSDTSALSNLAVVAHLWLLKDIYQTVIIPDVVASELAAASNSKISAILQLGWIQTHFARTLVTPVCREIQLTLPLGFFSYWLERFLKTSI